MSQANCSRYKVEFGINVPNTFLSLQNPSPDQKIWTREMNQRESDFSLIDGKAW